jgi:hypothetical protein
MPERERIAPNSLLSAFSTTKGAVSAPFVVTPFLPAIR